MSQNDVDYTGRPNKSLVRARILDIIEKAFRPSHRPDEPIAYISFSGHRFLDTLGFYGRFGIRSIFSIENRERRYRRARFNIPYGFFSIIEGRVSRFIDENLKDIDGFNKAIYLDYEWRFCDMIVEDLEVLFSSSFFDRRGLLFLTFNRGFDRSGITPSAGRIVPMEVKSPEGFKHWLRDGFSDYILNKVQKKYKKRKKVVEALKALYKDTSKMVALGYLIDDSDDERIVLEKTDAEEFRLPVLTLLERNFICNNLNAEPSQIAQNLGLTEREVRAILKYV